KQARTVAQILVGAGPDGFVPPGVLALNPVVTSQWFRKVRLMRRDPTLGLLRDIYQAALLGSEWTVECEHEEFKDAELCIKQSTVPFRIQFLRDALRGFLDFGWQPYEVVKEQHEDTGMFYVKKFKGLLQDLTTILVDYHVNMVGVRNSAIHNVLNPNPVYMYRGYFPAYTVMLRARTGTASRSCAGARDPMTLGSSAMTRPGDLTSRSQGHTGSSI